MASRSARRRTRHGWTRRVKDRRTNSSPPKTRQHATIMAAPEQRSDPKGQEHDRDGESSVPAPGGLSAISRNPLLAAVLSGLALMVVAKLLPAEDNEQAPGNRLREDSLRDVGNSIRTGADPNERQVIFRTLYDGWASPKVPATITDTPKATGEPTTCYLRLREATGEVFRAIAKRPCTDYRAGDDVEVTGRIHGYSERDGILLDEASVDGF